MPSTQDLDAQAPSAPLQNERVHLIDVGPLFDNDEPAREQVIKGIRRACLETGFFYVHNTRISDDLIGATLEQMQRFFSLDDADPRKSVARSSLGPGGTGWGPMFAEPAYQPGTVAHLESFDLSPPTEWVGNQEQAAKLGIYPNLWPDLPGFREVVQAYYLAARELGHALFGALAEAMGLSREFFSTRATAHAPSTMRLLNYPGQRRVSDRSNVGIAAHTDFECFTIMYQTAPGLELTDTRGQWYEAPANIGQFTVILGDMLERLSNGRWAATGHRVGITPWQRFSIILFNALDGDCPVAPLPQFVEAGRDPRYPATTQGGHIEEQIRRAEGYRDSDTMSYKED